MSDISHLIKLLQSDDDKKRFEACEELRTSQSLLPQEALDALAIAKNDKNPDVANAARKTLEFHTAIKDVGPAVTRSDSSSRKSTLLQLTLYLVMIATIILSVWIRMIGAGWLLFLFFIPLVIVSVIHFATHVNAIRKIPVMKPHYIFLILSSNLFFFLGYTLQVDTGDTSGGLALALFFKEYFNFIPRFLRIHSSEESKFMLISLCSLIAVIASWFFLIPGKYFLKESNSRN